MSNMFNMSQVTFLSWGNLVEGVWHRDMQTYIACFFEFVQPFCALQTGSCPFWAACDVSLTVWGVM